LKSFLPKKDFGEKLKKKIICLMMCGTPSTDGTGFVVYGADLAGVKRGLDSRQLAEAELGS
jgi:hypothetical protein